MSGSKDRVDDAQENSFPNFDMDHQLEARFECPICLQCLQDPVLTSCGHRFCSDCIHSWLSTRGNCCPVDNRVLQEDSDLFPDNFTQREIRQLEPRLKARGSDLVTSDGQLECPFKEVGCIAACSKEELPLHLETQIQHHVHLLSTAYNKLSCSIKEQKLEAKAQEAANLWEPDGKTKNTPSDAQDSVQGLIRSLYERIVLLEQQNREQGILIENLKAQVLSNTSSVDKIKTDMTLHHCSGTYIWSVPNFSAKFSNPQFMLCSPGFYTSPFGYKFCARLNLSPSNPFCLALNIHLMMSEHDSALDWPFSGRISFTLVNERDTQLNRRDVMISRPELEAFKRPTRDINPRGFGYSEFVTIQDLNMEGFLTDDTLTLKIQIQRV